MVSKRHAESAPVSLFWLTSLVFFVSGGTGLIYQVVWFKRFSHVWGSSSLAFAAVGASFLFGLGLGAYALGQRADRALMPLRWYGVCELLIGLLALIIPFEIAALVDASVGLYGSIPEQPLLRYLMQFVITLIVIGPPCVLMGGTLPLLIRQLTARDGSLDEATGWLYALNTFGAAAGCYLAGFHLLPLIGTDGTNYLAAGINIAIGVVSLSASNWVGQATGHRARAAHTPETQRWSPALPALYLATALAGCAALVLEMTWTRQLALILGGSTYAYTATLFVVLVGIALGSMVFHLFLRPIASRPEVPLAVIGLIAVSVVIGMWMLPSLSRVAGMDSVRNMRGDSWRNGLLCVGLSAALQFVPAVSMGVLFPLFVHLTQASAAKVGTVVGQIYAWNTLGSIAGASLTAVLLFPTIGTAGSTALAVGLYVLSLVAILPWTGTANLARVGVAAALGLGAVVLVARPTDPQLTNLGWYLYGTRSAEAEEQSRLQNKVEMFTEGASSNVLITRSAAGGVALRVNGKVDASDGVDMATQTGSAYFPRMFKPDAKEVLVIGYGSGCTPGRCLSFPGTHVTCCELEPAVYEASQYFGIVNGRPHELTQSWLEARNAELPADQRLSADAIAQQARLSMVFGDGRTAVQGSTKKYDLIISEPSNPWIAGCSNLFTQEFFRSAREHLTEGGVLAQWIQAYSFTMTDYLMIVRTMRTEFPYYGVVILAGGVDTLLLASDRPLVPDPQKLAELQKQFDADPELRDDLEVWFGGTDLRWLLLSNYQLGKPQLDALIDRDPSKAINTDLHLRLEFDAPLHLFREIPNEQKANLVLPAAAGSWLADLARSLGLEPGTAEFYTTLGDYALRQSLNYIAVARNVNPLYHTKAERFYRQALQVDPKHAPAELGLKRAALIANPGEDLEKALRQRLELDPKDSLAHFQLGQSLVPAKKKSEAIEHYREALRLEDHVSFGKRTYAWANDLAWMLATNREVTPAEAEEAVQLAKSACEATKYQSPTILDTLGTAYAAAGKYDDAIAITQRAIKMLKQSPEMQQEMENRVTQYRASQRFVDASLN